MAAKTDVGLVRDNNEDNFQVAADLASGTMRWVNNEVCSLGEKGALLVVADGMGGMNAGEVASGLAIETVKEYFAPQNITAEVMKNRFSIEKFMNSAIIAADERIKQEGKEHPESRGMGTTIVIAWILRHPADMQILLGSTKPERLRDSLKGQDVILEREEWYDLYIAAGGIVP